LVKVPVYTAAYEINGHSHCQDYPVEIEVEKMSEMVERVKKAIGKALPVFQNYTPEHRNHAARAAILAMREPTEGMVKAAGGTDKMKMVDGAMQMAQIQGATYPRWDWNESPLADGYRAMIDEALK
jgi:hypothetical protein